MSRRSMRLCDDHFDHVAQTLPSPSFRDWATTGGHHQSELRPHYAQFYGLSRGSRSSFALTRYQSMRAVLLRGRQVFVLPEWLA